eukprot:CAMPEP_0172659514 /NCGR_PEP_ID=MMETSP1074-20121228/3468_1 /TAXON_ID=2916 /ORGANISM="Ceratium fusus, Strain PA161109" /LENGTH=87 /DNA_ID=CAMNT_0013475003 /DNA_START=84 /DNA_END=344 /DNA_ORIENTATION=-
MASSATILLLVAAAPLASVCALDIRPDMATFAAALAAEEAEDGDFEALNLLQGAGALRKVQQRRRTEQQQEQSHQHQQQQQQQQQQQ